MIESKSISIIVPTINEANNLQKLIPFLTSMGKNNIEEVIVVDGGSTDGSTEIAAKYGAKVVDCPVRSRATQLNIGAKVSKGSILYFVHADSFPLDSFVEDILEAMNLNFRAGCYRYQFDSSKTMLKINSWFTRFNGLFAGGGDQTLFIEKSFFNELGGYDEKFTVMEDFELVKRIRRVETFRVIPKSIKVSARKYQYNSWLEVQWANLIAITAFKLGVEPDKIKKLYYDRLR